METRTIKKYDELNARLTLMQTRRSAWELVWNRIAELADPKGANFTTQYGPGQFNKGGQKTDSTLALAVPRWASAIDGLTTPKTQKWHGLTVSDSYLAEKYRTWLEEQRDRLFAIRYGAGSNFANANYENLKTIGFYGSGPFSCTEEYGKGITYKAWPVREFFVEQNFQGEVDVFFRKFTLTTRQALQQFGDNAPEDIKREEKLDKEWEFLHAVYPRTDYKQGRFDGPNKPIASDYLCLTTKTVVEEGGYDICPFFYSRYDVFASLQEPYGYSPTMLLLPEVKTLAAMGRSNLRVGNRASDPTYLMTDEDIVGAGRVGQPNAIIPGGLDAQGRPRVQAMTMPAGAPFTLEMLQDIRNTIKEGFDLNLFSILVNKPDMTATEVLQRSQEMATLLGPTTSRREKEFLAPLVRKEWEIAQRAGQLAPMPDELREALQAGQAQMQVQYESPIRRAQDAEEGTAIMRTVEVAAALQQFDPSVKNRINAGRTLERLSRVYGAPAAIFNTEEEQAAKDMNDQQVAQAQQILQAAPVISKSAKDLADAQATEGTELR